VSIAFLVTSLVVVVSPGTGVIYTLATALARGSRASVVAAVGCTLGIIPQMFAAIFGLAALLNASATAFQAVKYVGVAYLLYLAWTTLRERGGLAVSGSTEARSAFRVILTAILINLLNPKLTLFYFAFLPQFVSPHEANPIAHMLLLSLVFMSMTFVVFTAYGLLAATARAHILTRPRVLTWMRRTFAAAFVGLAARLALAGR
jgi:threonine/homoserine/homoserine lactone efflux protein